VGEGAAVVQQLHQYLDSEEERAPAVRRSWAEVQDRKEAHP